MVTLRTPSPIAPVKPFIKGFTGEFLDPERGCQGFEGSRREVRPISARGGQAGPEASPADTSAVGVATAQAQATGRPVGVLPIFQIFQLSIYWFGINAIWGGLNLILQRRMDGLVGKENAGSGLALLTFFGALVAILVQPTIGTI